jgi:hypothetical protein
VSNIKIKFKKYSRKSKNKIFIQPLIECRSPRLVIIKIKILHTFIRQLLIYENCGGFKLSNQLLASKQEKIVFIFSLSLPLLIYFECVGKGSRDMTVAPVSSKADLRSNTLFTYSERCMEILHVHTLLSCVFLLSLASVHMHTHIRF